MILTFQLSGEKLCHATHHQMGALVAHCLQLKNFHSAKVFKTFVEVSFALNHEAAQLIDQVKIQKQLENDFEALCNLDPMPCPCGCGAFIAITPCLRQSETLTDKPKLALTLEEQDMARTNNKIGAIKAVRIRTGLGLREAKDLVMDYLATIPSDPPF